MTGFDETVPPDDDPKTDENAVDPAHDSTVPSVEDDPDPDEPQGQYGPTAAYGDS